MLARWGLLRDTRRRDGRPKEAVMAIHQTAHYRVNEAAVPEVKAAIVEFVDYVRANEPGTRLYAAWQQEDDPTRFVHLFIFEDEAAQAAHSGSSAVNRFESAYSPHLLGGPVVFTDYVLVADNL
jgi:quinol monooxygenase YgiN